MGDFSAKVILRGEMLYSATSLFTSTFCTLALSILNQAFIESSSPYPIVCYSCASPQFARNGKRWYLH